MIGPLSMALTDVENMIEAFQTGAFIQAGITLGSQMLLSFWTSNFQLAVKLVPIVCFLCLF